MKAPVPNERLIKPLPPHRVLVALLDYDQNTGRLTWRARPDNSALGFANAARWNANFAGTPAFTAKDRNGYLSGRINNRKFLAHRVIWKLATGDEPDFIDHLNGDKADNRLCNLRSIPHQINNRNKALPKNNRSGVCGVMWMGHSWQARIVVDGKNLYLGRFDTFDAAVRQRKNAERFYGFSERHGSAK